MPSQSAGGSGTSSSSPNTLPPKENALFKRILKCYEQKQYKNGLKFAKQILTNPKFAEHGETLAMKGLTLNCLGRKEEAYDFVRRGLRNDLRSHVCWHVFGLLQRSDKKYDEAIKCYRNALKWDKDNIQILRDLSLLQIQMRDLEGYKETRQQLFQLRPTQRASWIGFAMSYHLLDDHEMALRILEEFRKTQQKAAYDYEHSELLLYQNMVIRESGDTAGALEHLEKYRDQICDKPFWLETKASLLIASDKHSEAIKIYEGLIKRNPENHAYYHGQATARHADSDEQKLELFAKAKEQYPRAQAPQRLALDVAKGSAFRDLLSPYMQKAIRKGVPPLFVDLRPLYADPDKAAAIEKLCNEFLANLRSTAGSFDAEGAREPATAQLWLLYYLAQHYDHRGEHSRALKIVDEAIEHTPTLIELYLLKGKIFKHVGDYEEAAKWMDEAQSLDTADRYINCKCAKYLLRANKVKEAEEMCQKFTREGVAPMDNLNEMQCMWFQTQCAAAFQRRGEWGNALKKCIEVDRHFTEIIEDQFDFHTYCMRKMTLRAYVDLLRLEDVLRSHRFYARAASIAIAVYLRLHEKPVSDDDKMNDLNTENMDPSELKKLRNKQKKAKRKAEQERQAQQQQQARKELHNKSQRKGGGGGGEEELDAPTKDELLPEKLERPEDPLAEALKFLQPLQMLAGKRLDTHLAAFEIYYRKRKPLLMLQSIKRALLTVKPENGERDPRIHGCVVRFQRFIEENRSGFSPAVVEVLEKDTPAIFGPDSAAKRNEAFIQEAKGGSLLACFVGAKMTNLLEPTRTDKALQLITKPESCSSHVNLETCSDILDSLSSGEFGPAGRSATDGFRSRCATLFPHSVKFRPPQEQQSTPPSSPSTPPSKAQATSSVQQQGKKQNESKMAAKVES